MKTFVAALAGLALVTSPLTASARGGGGGHGVGFSGAGGFHGGGFHDGGRFGGRGFGGRGFRGRGFGGFDDGFLFGADFGLGLGFYDPWFYGYGGYPDYAGYAYPAYPQYGPAPAGYYRGTLPADDASSRPDLNNTRSNGPTAKLCGSWNWDAAGQTYHWVTDGC